MQKNVGARCHFFHGIAGGPSFYGKPTERRDLVVACDRINGEITMVDILNLESPRLVRSFSIGGNTDLAFPGYGFVLIPAGRQGLIRFEL